MEGGDVDAGIKGVFDSTGDVYHRDAVISIESKGYALPIRCKQSNMVLMLMSMLMWISLVVMITERCSAQVCSPARPCLVLPGLAYLRQHRAAKTERAWSPGPPTQLSHCPNTYLRLHPSLATVLRSTGKRQKSGDTAST